MDDSAEVALMKTYELTKDDWDQTISDQHLQKIAEDYCSSWRQLPVYLGMKNIVKDDINRGPGDEEDKRCSFLFKWKKVKGASATYRKLVSALLMIECKADAEGVCEILQGYSTSSVLNEVMMGKCYHGVQEGVLLYKVNVCSYSETCL